MTPPTKMSVAGGTPAKGATEVASKEVFHAAAGIHLKIVECDSAATNKRTLNRLVDTLPWRTILFVAYCLVHQLHIIVGQVLGILSHSKVVTDKMQFTSSLYSLAQLMRTPGYFVRLLRNLPFR